MLYNNSHTYIIFSMTEINVVDFSQVLETSQDTVRLSVDGTKTVVKYDGDMPSSIVALTTKEGPYTHEEILSIMQTPEWYNPDDIE
jgi:hypothetical protein